MMTRSDMRHTAAVVAKLATVPPEKMSRLVARTVIGLIIAFVGIYAKRFWPGLSDTIAFATFGFGILVASGQLLWHPAKLGIALFRDFLRAWREKNGGAA